MSAFDPAEMGKRDETKFFDARNSAETEVPYSSKPSGTLAGLDLNLIDFEPRLALPGLLLEHRDQNRRYSDVLLRQRVLCRCCSRGRNSAWLTAARLRGGAIAASFWRTQALQPRVWPRNRPLFPYLHNVLSPPRVAHATPVFRITGRRPEHRGGPATKGSPQARPSRPAQQTPRGAACFHTPRCGLETLTGTTEL